MLEPHNNPKLFELNEIENKIYNNFINNKLHHSLLLLGQKGIGKATLSYHLANQILNFESSLKSQINTLFGETNNLFNNNKVYELIKKKSHPDLLIIEKEKNQKTHKLDSEIKISIKEKLLDFIHTSPSFSKNKIVIIDSIDEMNISAQNSILKILEEPNNNKFFFLICHNKNLVLDTILSRCQQINIKTPTFENWKNILSNIYEKDIQFNDDESKKIYNLSNGSLYYTVNIIENNGLQIFNQMIGLLSYPNLNIDILQNFAERISNDINSFNLFSSFIFNFLYETLKYFYKKDFENFFQKKDSYFILHNNEKTLLKKIKIIKFILSDMTTYNLNKKHSIIVIFYELIK